MKMYITYLGLRDLFLVKSTGLFFELLVRESRSVKTIAFVVDLLTSSAAGMMAVVAAIGRLGASA